MNPASRREGDATLIIVYIRGSTLDDELMILFWVDDIILASRNIKLIEAMKQDLKERFKKDDRGKLRWFLGVDFKRLPDGRYLMSQERYVETALNRFQMSNCNPANTLAEKGLQMTEVSDEKHQKFLTRNFPYRSATGSLIYLTVATRPDISWTVSKLSQFLDKPGIAQVNAVKRLMKYIQATKSYCLMFTRTDGQLVGHVDADWANDRTDIDDQQPGTSSHLEVHLRAGKRENNQTLLYHPPKQSIGDRGRNEGNNVSEKPVKINKE